MHSSTRTALVIGVTGTFGLHAAEALMKHGWRIRALARDPIAAAAKLGPGTPIDWRRGDAMEAASVTAAAVGADLIVHAANPPAYRNWPGTVIPMVESAIAAALASGARLALPGTVYNFAPDAGAAIAEDAPQAPVTRKGRIRAALETRLREASRTGLRVLILRSGDFFGPASPNSALKLLVRRRGARLAGVWAPGPAAVGHAWAYAPDLGETMARLADREAELEPFAVFHFRGHWLSRGDQLAEALSRWAGGPVPQARFPWGALRLAAPFNETIRELLEMRYLWEQPIGLAQGKLERFLGSLPQAPLDAALAATLSDLGLEPRKHDETAAVACPREAPGYGSAAR